MVWLKDLIRTGTNTFRWFRTSICGAIGVSPFYEEIRWEPRLPIDVKLSPSASEDLASYVHEAL